MELYKYCKREHMEALLAHGQLRVGTLFGYRSVAEHGEMTGDDKEGVIKITGNIISYDAEHFMKAYIDSTVTTTGSGADEVRHVTNDRMRSQNQYLFSTAANYSEEIHKKWFEQSGYDACYKILSARLFFREISKKIPNSKFIMVEPAYYMDETALNHVFQKRFHPALLKKYDHAEQAEVRALWEPVPASDEIAHVDILRSRAGAYCTPYRIIDR